MAIKTLGVDLGKNGCHFVGQDEHGNNVCARRLSYQKFAEYLVNLPACLVLFEACGGAHYWARKARSAGHQSKLIPAQFVKPFVKSNKNDWIDAEAICEAGQRPAMRFANTRSEEQQALGALLKLRDGLVVERTACINRGHAFLLEFGMSLNKGRGFIKQLAFIATDPEAPLPMLLRGALNEVVEQYLRLQEQIERIEKQLTQAVQASDVGKRLLSIPGVGVMTTGYVLAWIGDGKQFRSGREFAAWIGLVPKQHSTGGKTCLLGISKRGNGGLRKFLIHGARSAIQWKAKEDHAWSGGSKSCWPENPKRLQL